MLVEFVYQYLLGILGEVYHDISAEYEVKMSLEREGLDQIQISEPYKVAQGSFCPVALLFMRVLEVLGEQGEGDGCHLFVGIDAAYAGLEDVGVYVGCQKSAVPGLKVWDVLHKGNGNSVYLSPKAASGTPAAKLVILVAGGIIENLGNHDVLHKFKVGRFTVE